MKIRRILFSSIFLLLFFEAAILATLSFYSTQNALQEEIGQNLTDEAVTLMEQLDILMYERLQNAYSWSQLDIMQEARIGDIDKRLSKFLSALEFGYGGMYRHLFFVDSRNTILSASSTPLIGQHFQPSKDWLTPKIPNGYLTVEDLQLISPYQNANLVIRAPVNDRYTHETIGSLYCLFDMKHIFRMLDNTANSRSGERSIVLLDAQGRTIAASAKLRNANVLLKHTFADWKPVKGQKLFIHSGLEHKEPPLLVGYANSLGYLGYEQMGWSILVFQSTDSAFFPVRILLISLMAIIAFTLLLAGFASHWISGRIANPLVGLTEWVRNVRNFQPQPAPKLGRAIEIKELEMAFDEMLQELEYARIRIIQSAKLAVVGEMAAIMAHELRTPLGILTTSAQWLFREVETPECKEMAQFILDESARLNRLVTTLLESSRPREPQMSQHNVQNLLLYTLELLNLQIENKQIRCETQLMEQPPIFECDAELLTQVFLNLLLNAIQILPVNGRIKIKTTLDKQYFAIDIIDDGPGIAPGDYEHLFDPFFSKREGGIGLGLTVTLQLVQAHHGKLSASQSEWGGACFTILLPLRQEISYGN